MIKGLTIDLNFSACKVIKYSQMLLFGLLNLQKNLLCTQVCGNHRFKDVT